jgi:hypothetical protein
MAKRKTPKKTAKRRKKVTRKKAPKRATRKKVTKKATRKKAPKRATRKKVTKKATRKKAKKNKINGRRVAKKTSGYIIKAVNKVDGKEGYFTGKTFDTLKSKAAIFQDKTAARRNAENMGVPNGWAIMLESF